MVNMKGVTLIGMPGSGKSTVGKNLAELLQWKFVDLDKLILEKEGVSHDKILNIKGREELLRLENNYTLGLNLQEVVFSPGGSIVYSPEAMEKLKSETFIIYLDVPLEEIKRRIGDNAGNGRGVVDFKEKGIEGLFAERVPLYQTCAHYTIQKFNQNSEKMARDIAQIVKTL
jgi:shikimate kinase